MTFSESRTVKGLMALVSNGAQGPKLDVVWVVSDDVSIWSSRRCLAHHSSLQRNGGCCLHHNLNRDPTNFLTPPNFKHPKNLPMEGTDYINPLQLLADSPVTIDSKHTMIGWKFNIAAKPRLQFSIIFHSVSQPLQNSQAY